MSEATKARQSPGEILLIKDAIRERDGNRCCKCRISGDEHVLRFGRRLDVHRVNPGSLYAVDESCVTICRACHGPEPRRPRGQRRIDEPWSISGLMVRLPEEFRPVLEALQQKNERPMTIELQRALILYAKQEGVPAPASAIVGRQSGS